MNRIFVSGSKNTNPYCIESLDEKYITFYTFVWIQSVLHFVWSVFTFSDASLLSPGIESHKKRRRKTQMKKLDESSKSSSIFGLSSRLNSKYRMSRS